MSTRAWFSYLGTGSPTSNLSYSYVAFEPSCPEGKLACGVRGLYIPATYGLKPAPFSTNLITYINNAQAAGTAQPALSPTKYAVVQPID